jgi:hypothetical protein
VTKYIRVGVDDKNETSPYFDHEDGGGGAVGSEQGLQYPITTTLSSKEDECESYRLSFIILIR